MSTQKEMGTPPRKSESRDHSDGEGESQGRLLRKTFPNLMKIVLLHRGILVGGGLIILLGTAATLCEPMLFGYAIDGAILPKNQRLLYLLIAAFCGLTLTRVGCALLQNYLFEKLGQRVTQDLRVRLFSHLLRLPMSQHHKIHSGRLLTRVTNDVNSLGEMFSAGFISMICNIALVSAILVWMLVLSFRLGVIASSVFPLMVGLSIIFSKQLHLSYREARSRLSLLTSYLAENFSGMKIVHLFNRQQAQLSRFKKLNHAYADAQSQSIRIFAFFQPTITLLAGVSMGLVIWFGSIEVQAGHLKLGVLVAYFTYVMALFQPIREIADKWNIFLSGMASAERIFTVLSWPTELSHRELTVWKSEALLKGECRGEIEFRGVWFSYDGVPEAGGSDATHSWVLRDFSIRIRAGEKVGIVGHTGAGKSTLIALLLRFYEPTRGAIYLDGRDLRNYSKPHLRSLFGVVQQEPTLFAGSLYDNVAFWRSGLDLGAGFSSVSGVLRELGLEEGPGTGISGGQRQLVAFARAYVGKPAIWVLDEATSSVDCFMEASLHQALERVSQGQTTLTIAHRLATVQNADRILVLHHGRLVEVGSHDGLLNQGGIYAQLSRFQQMSQTATF